MKQQKKGLVSLVGAGPGDPGLITVKGLERLQGADVVIYDRLVSPILLEQIPAKARKLFVGKENSYHILSQEEIEKVLVREAKQGKRVVRLKGGDPFIFGRGGEEAETLQAHGIPFEIVSGVTAASAVPAFAGIPLTHRDFSANVTFVTGHEDPNKKESKLDWPSLAKMNTLVFFMSMGQLSQMMKRLITCGRSPQEPVAIIHWGTTTRQKTVTGTLQNIVLLAEKAAMKPPALIVVGAVVGCRERLNWFEKSPLFGQTILVMRTRQQAGELARRLERVGGQVISIPMLEIGPPQSYQDLDWALKKIKQFDWILWTSVNAVQAFMQRLKEHRMDLRSLAGIKLAAIGETTAEVLGQFNLQADIVATDSRAEGLVTILGQKVKGKKILLPRAAEGREELVIGLKKSGAILKEVAVYQTRCPRGSKQKLQELFKKARPQWVTFTSSMMAHHFVKAIGKNNVSSWLEGVSCAAIGPVTRTTLQEYGIVPKVMAKKATLDALVQGMVDFTEPSSGD